MASQQEIAVTNILLDLANPRLTEGQQSQAGTIQAMLKAEGPKTLSLAQSIAAEGLSPMERLLVMPSPDHEKRFIVLEGNRRVTALKILTEPSLADGVLTKSQMDKLKKWSADYRNSGEIETVECAIFDTRGEANPWIERRHRGDQGGVGIVRWGATEAARFDARTSGKRPPELQVLDYVAQNADLDEEIREKLHNVSITNLQRIIADKNVRDVLGLEFDKEGRVLTRFPDMETMKGLRKIVEDLAHDRVKVKDIYNAGARKTYLKKFRPNELPSESKALPKAALLLDGTEAEQQPTDKGRTGSKPAPTSRPRQTLIPSDCKLKIKLAKLQNINRELRKLRLNDYPNAVAVLFRVFVELTVDEVIERDSLMTEQQARNSKLRDKLTKAADHLQTQGLLTRKQASAVKRVANDPHMLHTSVTTMHEYVHNKHFSPSATDLRAAWDNIQPFFQAACP